MKSIHLVTKNPGKLMAAKSVFDRYDIKIITPDKDYPEIQADTSLEVARIIAIQAARDLNSPAIRAEITETLKQFPTVQSVIISINGRTEDILQP